MNSFLSRFFGSETRTVPSVPEGIRVYAIGDIHGRSDLLRRIHALIEADGDGFPGRKEVVYLGDYIDRGLESSEVLDLLIAGPPDGCTPVYLRGNHEDALLQFLQNHEVGEPWLTFGGEATLVSYGIAFNPSTTAEEDWQNLQADLKAQIPPMHLTFLNGLKSSHSVGGYFFAHAGIRPGVPLERQSPKDLMWIRDDFLTSPVDHGKVIVHGHSITFDPQKRGNRIGIDTGAYATGTLSCLVLEDTSQRIFTT